MTPGEIARRDQVYAAGLDQNRKTCNERGHWFWGKGEKCLRCGEDFRATPAWFVELFGAES